MVAALRPLTPGGRSFSAGVSERRLPAPVTPAALVAAADKALYRAKQGGRDRVVAAVDVPQQRAAPKPVGLDS